MFYERFKSRMDTAKSASVQMKLDIAAYDTYLATEFLLKALLSNRDMVITSQVDLHCLKSLVDSRYNYKALQKLDKHIPTLVTYSSTYLTHVTMLGIDLTYLKEVWSILYEISTDFDNDVLPL